MIDRVTRWRLRSSRRSALAAATFALAVPLASAGPAAASQFIDRGATGARLSVTSAGAVVTYRAGGASKQVLATGAINARPPNGSVAQVEFRIATAVGPASTRACGRYDGPRLHWLVAACKGPDGSYWALQSWPRLLPNFGARPAGFEQSAKELRLSHWSGPIAELEIKTDWAWRRFDHLYGRFTYRGKPVHGFRSTRFGAPLDSYGRNVYLDTFNSGYGGGWKRENSFLAHRPTGVFCYMVRPGGRGQRYRATVIGPGVTPDVVWEGVAPGPFEAAREAEANAEQRQMRDRLCRPN
jgi:hypothetical protein